MANGIEVVQTGANVSNAADYQKLLDSRWEFLEIENEYIVSFDTFTPNIVKLFDHNLGYLPAFTFDTLSGNGDFNVTCSNNSVYTDFFGSSKTTAMIRIFACDITSEYQAPTVVIDSNTQQDQQASIGIKVLNSNSDDINSTDMTDFSLNTNAKAISIQMHGTRATGDPIAGQLHFYHNVGYPPTYFVAGIITDPTFTKFPIINPMNQIFGFATADSSQITIKGAQATLGGNYGVLVLKDPVEVAS